jgi:hypothetical protein
MEIIACLTMGVPHDHFDERHHEMSSATSTWRERRQAARTRRALDRALRHTDSPAMRDELLAIANSSPSLLH